MQLSIDVRENRLKYNNYNIWKPIKINAKSVLMCRKRVCLSKLNCFSSDFFSSLHKGNAHARSFFNSINYMMLNCVTASDVFKSGKVDDVLHITLPPKDDCCHWCFFFFLSLFALQLAPPTWKLLRLSLSIYQTCHGLWFKRLYNNLLIKPTFISRHSFWCKTIGLFDLFSTCFYQKLLNSFKVYQNIKCMFVHTL